MVNVIFFLQQQETRIVYVGYVRRKHKNQQTDN